MCIHAQQVAAINVWYRRLPARQPADMYQTEVPRQYSAPIWHLVLAQYRADAGQHRPDIEPALNARWGRSIDVAPLFDTYRQAGGQAGVCTTR